MRERLRDGARQYETASGGLGSSLTDWQNCTISDVASPQQASLVGRRVGDVAAHRGIDAFDALLDIVTDDHLLTGIELYIEDNEHALAPAPRAVARPADDPGWIGCWCPPGHVDDIYHAHDIPRRSRT